MNRDESIPGATIFIDSDSEVLQLYKALELAMQPPQIEEFSPHFLHKAVVKGVELIHQHRPRTRQILSLLEKTEAQVVIQDVPITYERTPGKPHRRPLSLILNPKEAEIAESALAQLGIRSS